MTANPLHHLGLIRAQWQMISLHIKALKQLNELAPSQSSAQELALNSEALPRGTGELAMKAWEPHAEVHRRSSVSQVEKWIPAVSNLNCTPASLSPWLSSSKPSLTAVYSSSVSTFSSLGADLSIHGLPKPFANFLFYPVTLQLGFWVFIRTAPTKEWERKQIS